MRSGDRMIGRSGDRRLVDLAAGWTGKTLERSHPDLTTEARRHGERRGIREIADSAVARHWLVALVGAWRIAAAALREIFDESAYDRFLVRNHAVRSVESYREFLREWEGAAARRPRCC
jgi:hypothetical protein